MKDLSLIEILSFMPEAGNVFDSFRIDYYRKGWRTLSQACSDCSAEPEPVFDALTDLEFSGNKINGLNYFEQDLESLVYHIRNKFHMRERMTITAIESELHHAALNHPVRLKPVISAFNALSIHFLEHSRHEEENLFPYILKMEKALKVNDQNILKTLFHNDLLLYEEEHNDSMEDIEKLCVMIDQLIIETQDGILKALLNSFLNFRSELGFHLHLENNIVFPKSRLIESLLKSRLKQTG